MASMTTFRGRWSTSVDWRDGDWANVLWDWPDDHAPSTPPPCFVGYSTTNNIFSRSNMPCRRSAGVNQSAIIRSSGNVTHHLPTINEDIPTPLELCRPLNQLSSLYHLQYLLSSVAPQRNRQERILNYVSKVLLQRIRDTVTLECTRVISSEIIPTKDDARVCTKANTCRQTNFASQSSCTSL